MCAAALLLKRHQGVARNPPSKACAYVAPRLPPTVFALCSRLWSEPWDREIRSVSHRPGCCGSAAPGHVWVAKCLGCGRKSLLPTDRMLARVGERTPLRQAVMRLKCAECGHRGAEAYLGELPEPGAGEG